MRMEDLPVGSEIILKVVKTKKSDCTGCFFNEITRNIYENVCKDFKCSAIVRKDKKNIKFKRIK